MSHEIEMSALRSLSQTAKSLLEFSKGSYSVRTSSPSPPSTPPVLPKILLPTAPSLQSKLCRIGLDSTLVKTISKKYDTRCEELRIDAQTNLHRACAALALVPRHADQVKLASLLNSLISMHKTRYTKSLQTLEERVMSIAASHATPSGQPRRTSQRERRSSKPFNREFLPFLEKYFEYNAFPTAADRVEMAKKSMMEPRQIEVWFQNHRRRAKEEGRDIKKRPADNEAVPKDLDLQSMEEKMEPYIVPSELRVEVDDEVSEAYSDEEDEDDDDVVVVEEPEVIDLTDALNPPAPRHAFPAKFKKCLKQPSKYPAMILQTQQFSFPPPQWPRKSAVEPPRRADMSMDELSTLFGSLHVYDKATVKTDGPFKLFATTFTFSAPLPSLVSASRKITPAPVRPTTSLSTTSVSRSRHHPYSQPIAIPASEQPRRKKASGPPRRVPKKRASNSRRDTSPTSSEASTLRSVSPPSRAPSLESIGFIPSRTPSFGSSDDLSSRSSSYSSGPTTPSSSPFSYPLEIVELGDLGKVAQRIVAAEAEPRGEYVEVLPPHLRYEKYAYLS